MSDATPTPPLSLTEGLELVREWTPEVCVPASPEAWKQRARRGTGPPLRKDNGRFVASRAEIIAWCKGLYPAKVREALLEHDRFEAELRFHLATFQDDVCQCDPEDGDRSDLEPSAHRNYCPVLIRWRISRALEGPHGDR